MPRGQPISNYYQNLRQQVWQEIRSQTDTYLISVDLETFASFLMQKFGLPEIVIDDVRTMMCEKIRRTVQRDHFGELAQVERLGMKISLPVEPDASISKILAMSPSTWSTAPPQLTYSNGWISTEVSATETEVQRAVDQLRDEVDRRNADIQKENDNLRTNVQNWIRERKSQIENEDILLDEISKTVQVTLKQKPSAANVVPPTLKVKEKLRPIVRPTAKAPIKLELQAEKFYAILELIAGSCRLFERTPSTFAKLEEEELRDVILSNLNSVYEGDGLARIIHEKAQP